MKKTEVKKITAESVYPELGEISALLDIQKDRIHIDTLNWEGYSYKPGVELSMAYSDNEIFLKYYIHENYFKAEKTEPNQMVCEDSCVEFFVSPGEDEIYYNIEFNGIGTCLMGSGTERANSRLASPEIFSGIRRLSSAGSKPEKERTGEYSWDITIAIPFKVFFLHRIKSLNGKTIRANFYKCGDKLTVPHYVTWNPVGTLNPDFHQPKYFGILKFV